MTYFLSNENTKQYLFLNKKEWVKILTTALNKGWKPKGTLLKNESMLEVTELDGTITTLTNSYVNKNWTGSYTQVQQQIVTSEDANNMAIALRKSDVAIDIVQFISNGSFRIGRKSRHFENSSENKQPVVKSLKLRSRSRFLHQKS